MWSGENSPPTLWSIQITAMYINSRASRKLGTARPTNPAKVKTWSPNEYWRTAE